MKILLLVSVLFLISCSKNEDLPCKSCHRIWKYSSYTINYSANLPIKNYVIAPAGKEEIFVVCGDHDIMNAEKGMSSIDTIVTGSKRTVIEGIAFCNCD